MKGMFCISPAFKIGPEYFKTRYPRNHVTSEEKPNLTQVKECMDAYTADPDKLRDKFWKYIEQTLTGIYGLRNGGRRKYMNEHGCYIFTWGTTPFYIGKTVRANGFFGECFEKKHKLSMLKKYISSKKAKNSSLNLYLIFWNGKQNAVLDDIVDHMETYLITKAIDEGFYFDLMNDKKTSHKWEIAGFRDSPENGNALPSRGPKKDCASGLKKVFDRHPLSKNGK